MVFGFEETGFLVERAKNTACDNGLSRDIVKVRTAYNSLAELFIKIEHRKCTISEAHDDVTNLEFGDDSCNKGFVKKFLTLASSNDANQQRLQNNAVFPC